jgi:dihydrofolate reductase
MIAGKEDMNQDIIIIVAMSENRVIGKDGKLPWSIKEDMLHFKELTTGFPCIMGRKTYESLPHRPLPNRENLIISSNVTCTFDGAKVFNSINSAINYCKDYSKIFICGGASIYKDAINFADKIELTLVHGNYEGDTYFPEVDKTLWKETGVIKHGHFSFITLVRE